MAKTEKNGIIERYMQYVLENSERPASVYKFCQLSGITEKEFYSNFGSFSGIEKAIFEEFFKETIKLLKKNKDYSGYEINEKLLSFYYTFIAILTENRSYVLQVCSKNSVALKELEQLQLLRKHFQNYTGELLDIKNDDKKSLSFIKGKTLQEGAWIQFLLILKFWLDDESPGFEKTDLFIEKSVKASFELVNSQPFDSLVDLGKFLFKEKVS